MSQIYVYLKGLVLVVLLSACASTQRADVAEAASTPLNDLNLLRKDVPAVLQQAERDPYALPNDLSCESVLAQVQALDEVLAPDIDSPDQADVSMGKKAVQRVGRSALGVLRSTAEDLVPFRSWVRKLTGAERHSRKVSAAIGAGVVRRAFLKGVAASRGCLE